MVRFLRTKYQQYKRDTQQLSTWLAQAALQHGYPLDHFARSAQPSAAPAAGDAEEEGKTTQQAKQQAKNAKKKAKLKAKKQAEKKAQVGGAASAEGGAAAEEEGKEDSGEEEGKPAEAQPQQQQPLEGEYILKSHQYPELADLLVSKEVAIPKEVMQLIKRCVRLRNSCLRRFLGDPDSSTRTHEFFISILVEVGEIFTVHREKLAERREKAASKKQAEAAVEEELQARAHPASGQANRFASLVDLNEAGEEHEEDMPDIQLPEAPRPRNSNVSAKQVTFDLEESTQTAAMELITLYADMHDMRDYIKALWRDYRNGKLDLVTAAVTSNTALELMRRTHDEVMANVLPWFDNSLDTAIAMLGLYLGQFLGPHLLRPPLPVYNALPPSFPSYLLPLYDYLMVPNLQILIGLEGVIQDRHAPLYKTGYYGLYNPSLDFNSLDYRTKWHQVQILCTETLGDYLMLMCTFGPEASSAKVNAFLIDELAIGMDAFARSKKPTLNLMFGVQVLLDINFELGSTVKRGLAELRAASVRMVKSLQERERVESADKPPTWSQGAETAISAFKHEASNWTAREDPPTIVRKSSVRKMGGNAQDEVSELMPRNPMHSGNLPGKTGPEWPDMDKIIEMHRAEDIFGGKIPTTVDDSLQSFLRMTGSSIEAMQAMRRLGTDAQPTTAQRNRKHVPSSYSQGGTKGLKDHTAILPIFFKKYIGDETGTRIDIAVIEALLSELKAHQEAEEEKRARKEAAGGSSGGRRKPLRKERLHRSAKFSLLQLLAVLEAGLAQETESIRFDYVSMHVRCLRALRAVKASAHDYLVVKLGPTYMVREYQLAYIVGWILYVATLSGRGAEQMGINRERLAQRTGIVAASRLLVEATDTLRTFLSDPNEAAAELSQMRLGV